MAYLENVVFQNGNLTVSGFSKNGAIIPANGIDTDIVFKFESIANEEILLPLNKINFPVRLMTCLHHNNSSDLIIKIYSNLLERIPTNFINISDDIFAFPYLIVTPNQKVTLKAKNHPVSKVSIFAKPINIYEVTNG